MKYRIKIVLTVVALLVICIIVFGCSKDQFADKAEMTSMTGMDEISTGIYDDGESTAWIRVDHARLQMMDASVAELVQKKQKWQKKYPEKRIITWTMVTADVGSYGAPAPGGLLIHYEKK